MSDYVANRRTFAALLSSGDKHAPSAHRSTGVECAGSTALGDPTAEKVMKSWTI
jgi:hypothetical protein